MAPTILRLPCQKMEKIVFTGLLATSLALTPTMPNMAYTQDAPLKYQDWYMMSETVGCSISSSKTFQDPAVIVLIRIPGEFVRVIVSIKDPAIELSDDSAVTLTIDGKPVGSSSSISFNEGRTSWIVEPDQDFVGQFTGGQAITVSTNGNFVTRLSLAGSGRAIAAQNLCVKSLPTMPTSVNITAPPQPSAPIEPIDTSREGPTGSSPRGIASWAGLIARQYPAAALRNGEEGTVRLTAVVTEQGSVSSCEVTGSSGSEALDLAACSGMVEYGRFQPALDANSQPIQSTYNTAIRYQIPDDHPMPAPDKVLSAKGGNGR